MIFDMLIKTLPNYESFETMLEAIDVKLTGQIAMAPYAGVYGEVDEDTTSIGDVDTAMTLTGDVATLGTDITDT